MSFYEKKLKKQLKEIDATDYFVGKYYTRKLIDDLNRMIEKDKEFCLIYCKIINLEELSMYLDHDTLNKLLNKVMLFIKKNYSKHKIYSGRENEFFIILDKYYCENIKGNILKNIETYLHNMQVEEYKINIIMKVGVVNYNGEELDGKILFNRAKIALSQNKENKSSVRLYDAKFEKKMRFFHEISGLLVHGMNNNEIYVVYQPIINIKDKSIASVEVLARWDRGNEKSFSPDVFIKIAEESGLVQSITKEIIKKHINEIVKIKKNGIEIKCSINITANELTDDYFIIWLEKLIDDKNIDICNLGFEITERVFIEDLERSDHIFSKLQKKGYTISIDDFGTGYNSIKNFNEIKADIIKIDKYFIDNIENTKHLIEYIIESTHRMGAKVVAEGVETKEQLDILKELGCDMIQGYYFSKPLSSEEFIEYYKSFDISKY